MKPQSLHKGREGKYRIRLLAALAFTEFLVWSIFTFWPTVETDEKSVEMPDPKRVELQHVEITYQRDIPASPPKPAIAIAPPEEKIIEEKIQIEQILQEANFPDSAGYALGRGENPGAAGISPVENPDRPPSLFKIVEPVVPEEARKANIKAVIEVRFMINAKGNVMEASIARIKLYDENGQDYRIVDHIGYGLTEATLKAALQWQFTPAVKNGSKVPTYSIHTFTYGF